MYNNNSLSITKSVLFEIWSDILAGDFDGWGLDPDSFERVISAIDNLENGVYGDRISK